MDVEKVARLSDVISVSFVCFYVYLLFAVFI